MRTPSSVLLAFILTAALAQAAAALTIDNFEEGNFTFPDDTTVAGPTFGEVSGLSSSNVLGGVRLVRPQAGGNAGVITSSLATTPGDDGALTTFVGQGNGQVGFIYDGVANNAIDGISGALALNMTPFTHIQIDATAVAVTAFVEVTIYSSTQGQISSQIPLVNGATLLSLASFTLNLADIRTIYVNLLGIDPGEVPIVSNISAVAVPEPASGLLIALGLVGIGLARRR